jgi:hypothetical protein
MFGNKDDQQQNDQGQEPAQFQAPPPVTPSVPEPTPNATLETSAPDGTAAPSPAPSAPPELPGKSFKMVTPPSAAPSMPSTPSIPGVSDDLLTLKQDALQQLSPLVSHLDQTPEERFRTTMMMIQATDDSSKIKDAYDAAQAITDEKARAQALLDIVNEINYFTQQHHEK